MPAAVGTNVVHDLHVPHTYCWSSALIPKPEDWGPHIGMSCLLSSAIPILIILDVVGFFFVPQLAQNYVPPPDLNDFLNGGPPPICII